jgi:hypothetical protein
MDAPQQHRRAARGEPQRKAEALLRAQREGRPDGRRMRVKSETLHSISGAIA